MADKRFSALATDPRYRFPSRKKSRTAIDPRFKGVFTDADFQKKATVDRYGRKIKPESAKTEWERLYRLEKEDKTRRPGRGAEGEAAGRADEESDQMEEEQLAEKKDPAREGGFSESSSDEESTSGEESQDEEELAEETASQEQAADIPSGDVTHRIAAVNMDWDNLRATDIMAVASRFAPATGSIESVTIYPSEFGRERMEQEELRGPPKEIFASSKRKNNGGQDDEDSEVDNDDEDDEKIMRKLQRNQLNEGEEFDMPKLRQYQLDRLRYYYAVITCDSKTTAKTLYDTLDKREYFSTANYFDLRFIPEDTSFLDDVPQETCTKLPTGYKPREFRTGALTHSKVRLTWDDEDPVRKEVQKRAFSRAEMDENDLQAYIASDISESESVTSRISAAEERKAERREASVPYLKATAEKRGAKKDLAKRAKTRALLGLSEEPAKSNSKSTANKEVVGDIQITFTPGLSGNNGKGVFVNEPQDEESTRERYMRRERERKQKRKEKIKAARGGAQSIKDDKIEAREEAEDQGFDDPFFTDPTASAAAEKKAKKADKQKKLAAQAVKDDEAAGRRAELELLMADDQADNLKHFDMREIERAEKEAKRKHKKKDKKREDTAAAENMKDNFKIETKDPRFKDLYESHEYAIDPSNPRFKGTAGMKELLEEGRRKRKLSQV